MGVPSSTHFAPNNADAGRPAMTPCLPDHSHAALAHSATDGSTPRGAQTPG